MGTERRARQKANRQLKLEQQEKDERRDRIRQYGLMAAVVAVAIVGGLALLSYATRDDTPEVTETAAGDEGAEDAAVEDSESSDEADVEGVGEPIGCPAEDGSSEQVLEFPAPPPTCIDPSATYTATFDTNLGTITAELDASKAPATVNNFVYLARYHYYDGTAFHRIIDDFMIQGGDPTGEPPGTGGPGYTIDEEVPEPGEYQIGSLAMAKRSAPGTTGAQFFIVTGPNGVSLPNQYSLFGQVTEGLDVVEAIEALPTDDRDFPTEEIVVNSITITET